MKILKKICGFFGITIFSFSLFLALIFYLLHNITNYENLIQLASEAKSIIIEQYKQKLTKEQLNQLQTFIEFACAQQNEIELEVNGKIILNCKEIEGKNIDQIIDAIATKAIKKKIDSIHFSAYDCDFFTCYKQNKFEYYVSKNANELYNSFFFYSFLAIIFSTILVFVSAGILNGIKNIGGAMIFIGITYFFKFFSQPLISKILPIEMIEIAMPFIQKILNQIFEPFLWILIFGAILLFSYYLAKILGKKKII